MCALIVRSAILIAVLSAAATAQTGQTITVDVGGKPFVVTRTIGSPASKSGNWTLDDTLTIVIKNIPEGKQPVVEFACGHRPTVTVPQASIKVTDRTATFVVPQGGTIPDAGKDGQTATLTLPCNARVIVWDPTRNNDVSGSVQMPLVRSAKDGTETADAFAYRKLLGYLNKTYDISGNTVHVVVGPNGRMLSAMPVNTDQDDHFVMTIIARKSELPQYDVRVDEGIYAPSDFAIRPAAAFKAATTENINRDAPESDPFDTVSVVLGPYTSASFRFTVTYDDTAQRKTVDLRSYSIRINPLYHAGLGIAVVRSKVPLPSYEVLPRDGSTNTIRQVNGGTRSIASLSAVLYWPVFSKDFWRKDFWRGGVITRGRDPLKEASFVDRIFPMVGIGMEKTLTDNVFVGGVFEIARGASITGGWHFGKTTVLADPNFVLGTTAFSGETKDIKTSTVSVRNTFVGLMLDTRLVSAIIGLAK